MMDLVGKFFHDFDDDGKVQHQGHIVDMVADEVYVVDYADWMVGEKTWGRRLVRLAEIVDGKWVLYDSADEMRDSYEHGGVPTVRG